MVADSGINIICLSEHFQKKEIESLQLNDYNVVNSFSRKSNKGGGVCILSHKNTYCDKINFNNSEEKIFESCVVQCSLKNVIVTICVVYRSPSANFEAFMDKLSTMMENIYNPSNKHIICGDINTNLLLQNNKNTITLLNFFLEYNIRPTVDCPTRITSNSETCIDNFFTDFIGSSFFVGDSHMSDHTYQILTVNHIALTGAERKCITKRLFSNNNITHFEASIARIDWTQVLNANNDLNTVFNNFYSAVKEIFDACFPKVSMVTRTKVNSKQNRWVTHEIRELSSLLKEMAAINKQINNDLYNLRYKQLKQIYDKKIALAKKTFNNNRLNNAPNVNKECWNIIKENNGKNKNQNISEIIDGNGIKISNSQEICSTFNNHFIKITNDCNLPNSYDCSNIVSVRDSLYLHPTDPTEIAKAINKVCKKKSAGSDEIPGTVILAVSQYLASPLSFIINKSFLEGQYPEELKNSKIVPIFKNKGIKTDICNYRPVALQCQFAKIFEYCFNLRLTSFLEKNNVLSKCQNGFRANHSTGSALNQAFNVIHDTLNKKKQITGLFFDMSRAFDTVDHHLLIAKLTKAGIRGPPNDWIRSYLYQRSQQVEINGSCSEKNIVARGTPQGSCLSPTLFNIFINDLPDSVNDQNRLATLILYADDTNILISGESRVDVAETAQSSINAICSWCNNNGITLNPSKSVILEFCTKNKSIHSSMLLKADKKSIENVSHTKFLGVFLDQKLTWNRHIDYITAKLSSNCYLIRNMKNTVSVDVLKLLYFGLFQSILSYGLIYWGLAYKAFQAFLIQKKALRAMEGVSARTSCRPIFKKLGIMTLPSLYIYSVILFIVKQNKTGKRENVHDHFTRSNNELIQSFSRLATCQTSPNYMGVKCYNKLLKIDKCFQTYSSISCFKSKLKMFMVDKCYYSMDEFFND